jgi:uncharacterized ion transporter superfamily protein YfcC
MSFRIPVPHTLVLLFLIMILAWLLTLILPAGAFTTVKTDTGSELVVPGSYQAAETNKWLSPLVLLTSIPQGLGKAQDVIFFVLLIGGVIAILRKSQAIEAAIGLVLKHFSQHFSGLLLAGMFVFCVFSSTFGMAEEYLAFVGILISLCLALRLDPVTAVGIMVVGYGVGYGCAIINPFTVIVAQQVAELETGSGWLFRLLITVPFFLIGYHHLWSYATKIRRLPSLSLVQDWQSHLLNANSSDLSYPPMTTAHRLILLAMIPLIGLLFYGVMYWGWYLTELSALFLGFGILVAVLARLSWNEIGDSFIEGASQLTGTAILIGFARAITVILEQGEVLHTIVNGLANLIAPLPAELSAVGMLGIQYLMNFFIPSGSGQAYVTMPVMAPLGDLVGVQRQVAVLAFQFGDGFTNMIVPTNAVLMGILGLAGISYGQWFRFIFPLILKFFILGSLILILAVRINWQ